MFLLKQKCLKAKVQGVYTQDSWYQGVCRKRRAYSACQTEIKDCTTVKNILKKQNKKHSINYSIYSVYSLPLYHQFLPFQTVT